MPIQHLLRLAATGASLPGFHIFLERGGMMYLSWCLVPCPLQEEYLAPRTGHLGHVACSNFPGPNLLRAPNDAAGNRIVVSLRVAAQSMAARLAVGAWDSAGL